jgi:type IV conjugative transfer system protein TraE
MDNRYWQWFKKQTRKERYRLWSVIVMLLVIVALQSVVLVALKDHLRVVVVPATLTEMAWLDHDAVAPRYVKAMAEYLSLVYLTTTPSTEEAHLQTMLRYSAPESQGALKAGWLQRQEKQHREDIATFFSPLAIEVQGLTAIVSGELRTVVGKEEVLREQVRYRLEFEMVRGQLQLVEFVEFTNEEKLG